MRFAQRLAARVLARESQLVLGLDPDPRQLWPESETAAPEDAPPARRAAAAVAAHCRALIEAVAPACVAIKPQLACFERLGAPGREALADVVDAARAQGLLVLADGKRGDIDVTASAYAEGLLGGLDTAFGPVAGLGADAFTANPLLGRDSLAPFTAAAGVAGAGVFVLVRTSNPGAADLQDLVLADGRALWERLAEMVDELGGGGPGLADVGAVFGATAPAHLARARELMPRAVFLLPGIGAQGGRVEDLLPAFAVGAAGGLVSASRSIARAHETGGSRSGDPAGAARAEAERLRRATWELSATARA